MLAGVLVGTRLRLPTGDRKPLIMLFSFGLAIALLIGESLAPALELPILLLVGGAVGFGCKLMDERDGYLVRDNGPEEGLD
jgi:hypothetical protein